MIPYEGKKSEKKHGLTMVRGLPGSGKSTYAKCIVETYKRKNIVYNHFEADDYFTFINSETHAEQYDFNAMELSVAHSFCQYNAFCSIDDKKSVVVSNTFIDYQSMLPYIRFSQKRKIRWKIIECCGKWKSIHDVPDITLNFMKTKWVPKEMIIPLVEFEPGYDSYEVVCGGGIGASC